MLLFEVLYCTLVMHIAVKSWLFLVDPSVVLFVKRYTTIVCFVTLCQFRTLSFCTNANRVTRFTVLL